MPRGEGAAATAYEALRWRAERALSEALGERVASVFGVAMTGPDLVHLYVGVLRDPRVPVALRGELIACVLYILSPVDLFAESLFGPVALLDDAVVFARLLDALLNRVEEAVVRDHFPGGSAHLSRLQWAAAEARRVFAAGLASGARRLVLRAADVLRAGLLRGVHALPGFRDEPIRGSPRGAMVWSS